ncbi:MAG TPA: outer membrane lipoprotein chaperone LolA [Burkholderiales bacterium]|jgi:outer membrane lipoprotein carrier protein|nr:outer membrane lipoprotein chaperone LolA [Burkholderiales bacterium]
MHTARLLPLLWAFALPAAAGPIEQLEAFIQTTRAARADFTQTVTGPEGKDVQQSSGTVEFFRPGRFRWEYKKPFVQLIVADGERLWIYDKDLNQVTIRKLDKALGSSPAALLAGTDEIERFFSLEAQGRKGGLDWLQARPYEEDSLFERVRMGFAKNTLATMELYDHFGQKTVIRFSRLERNPGFAPGTFSFTPPPGADVVTD